MHNRFSKNPGVYMIVNLTNNKVYIGSSTDLRRRARDHIASLKLGNHNNKHLQNSWNLLGEKNFIFIPVCECDVGRIVQWEQFFIDHFQSANNEFGYNLSPTAKNILGYKFTDEQKAKAKARCSTPEFKKQISERSKKMWQNKDFQKMQDERQKKYWTKENRAKKGQEMADRWKNKNDKEKIESLKKRSQGYTEAVKAKMSKSMKKNWDNKSEDYKEKIRQIRKEAWDNANFEQKEKRLSGLQKSWNGWKNLSPEQKENRLRGLRKYESGPRKEKANLRKNKKSN